MSNRLRRLLRAGVRVRVYVYTFIRLWGYWKRDPVPIGKNTRLIEVN